MADEKPQRYTPQEREPFWASEWERSGVYHSEKAASRDEMFVVDTPPPTVSGSLHVGHLFSYTQTDIVVRYQRMKGKKIFYPMGWDDNGLPTERRVQNKLNIRCNPELPYDPNWVPNEHEGKPLEVSRRNFIEACDVITKEDEKAFEELWRRLGLSVDWNQSYATINAHCRKVSQYSFLDLVEKGFLYHDESPTMWDVDFRTAVAQADLEDRIKTGAFHDLRFGAEAGGEFVIATTRPELLASCIAVVAHPTDERYKPLFGTYAITPLFGARVPILASEHADPEKGSGIMMICTFGDAADAHWWKQNKLPLKTTIGANGRMISVDFTSDPFRSIDPDRAAEAWSQLVGLRVDDARKKVAELLTQDGTGPNGAGIGLIGQPKPLEHPVKFYEKGDRPIEFVTTRQWFVRVLDYKQELLAQAAKIQWHPAHMKARYDTWVEGLAYDWCISRQRFFGVPFPVWYPINDDGVVCYQQPIYAKPEQLPVDPLTDTPPGFTESQRNQNGGFAGDPDVMDTWATSSLTPQLNSYWGIDNARHESLFPMDMRPQAHEIIRTWAFYTIAKAWMHHKTIPWKNVVVSGWILDPDRKKMSKSKGNVVTPQHYIDEYSADAVRYWTGRARLGVDTAFDANIFTIGQRLATKLYNATKFVLTQIESSPSALPTSLISEPLDRALVDHLCSVIEEATAAFEEYDYAQALQVSESAFWFYCDTYLELVKARAYGNETERGKISAHATLAWSMKTFLRLFAPVLPYVTEEMWNKRFAAETGNGSIHRSTWPSTTEVDSIREVGKAELLKLAAEALGEVHGLKTRQKRSLGTPLTALSITGAEENLTLIKECAYDLASASRIAVDQVAFTTGNVEEKRFSADGALAEA